MTLMKCHNLLTTKLDFGLDTNLKSINTILFKIRRKNPGHIEFR